MLGKCLWKIHCHHSIGDGPGNDYNEVLEAFVKAIEFVPSKKDNRHPDKDPILEPHYKLVSVIHKLVQQREMTVRFGYPASMNFTLTTHRWKKEAK